MSGVKTQVRGSAKSLRFQGAAVLLLVARFRWPDDADRQRTTPRRLDFLQELLRHRQLLRLRSASERDRRERFCYRNNHHPGELRAGGWSSHRRALVLVDGDHDEHSAGRPRWFDVQSSAAQRRWKSPESVRNVTVLELGRRDLATLKDRRFWSFITRTCFRFSRRTATANCWSAEATR